MNDSPDHSDLPLPEYDHIPIGHLPARIAPLEAEQVQVLVDYEHEHGNRLPVLVVLEHRLEALRGGAEPSGSVASDLPEVGQASSSSAVSPGTTNAPKINPPSQGDPTNPAR
ncbi:MAG: hypothetical protein JWM50_2743 [Microbacteriaceae bacterium]|jgi:hypothetical protein|nr:hypothetical protein [Microbacteriaceae bacterium]